MRASLCLILTLLSPALASDLAGQERKVVTAKTPSGKVQISYTPTTLRGRGLKDLPKGTVWRMSAGPAAELITEIPLRYKRVILAPGSYRLSARYLGGSKFRLLIFRGLRIFQDGTPYQEIPLVLSEESGEVEKLTFRVWAGEDDGLRGRLHWGKQSLNFEMQPMGLSKFRMKVAGKPATLQIFALPKAEALQEQLKSRIRLAFGTLKQDGANGIEWDLFALNKRREFQVVCRNSTLDRTRVTLEAERNMKKRFVAMANKAADNAKAAWKTRLEAQDKLIASLEATVAIADKHARKVTIRCNIRGGQMSTQLVAKQVTKKSEELPEKLTVDLGFGARSIRLTLDGKLFVAEEDD